MTKGIVSPPCGAHGWKRIFPSGVAGGKIRYTSRLLTTHPRGAKITPPKKYNYTIYTYPHNSHILNHLSIFQYTLKCKL